MVFNRNLLLLLMASFNIALMTTRRNFLRNSGLAASALIVAQPQKVIANTALSNQFGLNDNTLSILYSGNSEAAHFEQCSASSSFEKVGGNAVFLNVSHSNKSLLQTSPLMARQGYHAVLAHEADAVILEQTLVSKALFVNAGSSNAEMEPVRIIYAGKVKIGIVGTSGSTNKNGTEYFETINRFAQRLKEERQCNIVICISSMGFKNENKVDDCTLATQSEHIDVIITSNNDNPAPATVLLNKLGHEVLIDNAPVAATCKKIDIKFNNRGEKQMIQFVA